MPLLVLLNPFLESFLSSDLLELESFSAYFLLLELLFLNPLVLELLALKPLLLKERLLFSGFLKLLLF